MAQIICNNLVLGYDSNPVVSGLSFSVSKGDYLCIVGENGSGKTTLMKTLLGLMSPISGSVCFGEDFSRKNIGYLPQQTSIQKDFPASVREIVISGCLNSGKFSPFYSKNQKSVAEENMTKLGISSLANRCYRELSGGQQQRVLLARALCAAQKMLLLDEPVSGLDPKVTGEMYELIYDLNKNYEITVIMISHDISAAVKYASHILHIGDSIFFGTKEECLKNDGLFYKKGEF